MRAEIARTMFHDANAVMQAHVDELVGSGYSEYESIIQVKGRFGRQYAATLQANLHTLGATDAAVLCN